MLSEQMSHFGELEIFGIYFACMLFSKGYTYTLLENVSRIPGEAAGSHLYMGHRQSGLNV